MPRRMMKLLAVVLFPLSFLSAQPNREQMAKMTADYKKHLQRATEMNDLAGAIHSPDDALKLVDMIADEFAEQLPPRWITRSFRKRLAQAEYESVTNPDKLIPEQQIADAWNRYITEIGAPPEALVTAAEVHYSRDAFYTSVRTFWPGGNRNIWTMPNTYAVGPDGKVESGARVIEALRIVWDYSNQYENLQGAHEAVKKGYLLSDHFRPPRKGDKLQGRVEIRARVRMNPVEDAEIRYTKERGEAAMTRAITRLVSELLPVGD